MFGLFKKKPKDEYLIRVASILHTTLGLSLPLENAYGLAEECLHELRNNIYNDMFHDGPNPKENIMAYYCLCNMLSEISSSDDKVTVLKITVMAGIIKGQLELFEDMTSLEKGIFQFGEQILAGDLFNLPKDDIAKIKSNSVKIIMDLMEDQESTPLTKDVVQLIENISSNVGDKQVLKVGENILAVSALSNVTGYCIDKDEPDLAYSYYMCIGAAIRKYFDGQMESYNDYQISALKTIMSDYESLGEELTYTHKNLNASSEATLILYQDKEFEMLKAQLRELETIVQSLSEKRDEQILLIHEFDTQLQLAIGNLIRDILKLRCTIEQKKLNLKKQQLSLAKEAYEREKHKIELLKAKRESLEKELESLEDFNLKIKDIEDALEDLTEQIREQQHIVRKKLQELKEAQERLTAEETSEDACQEAEKDYQEYENVYKQAKKDKLVQLNEADARLLKKLYRKAARLCHPDTVADDLKAQATEMMQALNCARDLGDIEGVRILLQRLENGIAYTLSSEILTSKYQIENKIAQLLSKTNEITAEIELINSSDTWQILESIKSWDSYFEEQRKELDSYLTELKTQYSDEKTLQEY